MRPKTLPAAVVPVALGSALAWQEGKFAWVPAVLCLGFALLVQVATNLINDYLDWKKGADQADRIGPVRVTAAGLIAPEAMRRASGAVLAAAFATGCGLIPFGGWGMLGVGLAALACAWLYTGGPFPLAYHGLGDVFVVLFFGLVAVVCTHYVQAREVTWEAAAVGLGCGLMVNNILVINNYRDADQDRRAGKRTLAVRFGRGFALFQYQSSMAVASLVPLFLLLRGYEPTVLFAVVTYPAGRWLTMTIGRMPIDRKFNRALGWTSLLLVVWGGLLAGGIIAAETR